MVREYIPREYRKPVYGAYAVIGLLIGAVQVGYGAAEAGQPTWLTVALAVYAFIGGGIGFVASSNTPEIDPIDIGTPPDQLDDEDDTDV